MDQGCITTKQLKLMVKKNRYTWSCDRCTQNKVANKKKINSIDAESRNEIDDDDDIIETETILDSNTQDMENEARKGKEKMKMILMSPM